MPMTEAIRELTRAKSTWLDHMVRRMRADNRVAAVWLFGSEGEGRADELSDIDLFVAFRDPAASELSRVPDWLSDLGDLLRSKESPYNAPEEGRYFNALYSAHPLPIVIDSYWQPASRALFGSDIRILLDRVGIPRAEPPIPTYELIPSVRHSRPYVPPAEPIERVREEIEWFFLDVPVVAKHRARKWPSVEDETGALWSAVDNLARYLGRPLLARNDRPAGLRPLVAEMETLLALPEANAIGAVAPRDVHDWLTVSETLIEEGWSPRGGSARGVC